VALLSHIFHSPIDVRPIGPGDHISDCGDRTPPRFSPSGSPSRHRRWHRIGSFKTNRKVIYFKLFCFNLSDKNFYSSGGF